MCVRKLNEVNISWVATISGTDFTPTGIGTLKWSWKYDKGKSHIHRFERALYFPDSPVNIISSTDLDDQYDNNDVTFIKTKFHSSEFSWNFRQYTLMITHSANCLAEMPINDGYEVFGVFLKRIQYQMDPRIYFCNCSHMTQTDLPEDKQFPQVDFGAAIVPCKEYSSDEEEDKKILYMENQAELENTTSQPDGVYAPPTALINANQTEERQFTFNISEEIRYTKDGHNKKSHILTGNSSNEGM